MFEFVDTCTSNAVIKVIGVGGGGGNAIDHMVMAGMEGVEFISANTDAQALKNSSAKTILQLGDNITKGLGAGANPDIGREAAKEDRERIMEVLNGADMVFLTAGMGGGTGTGGIPVVAECAKELGILTVGVVTKPFPFEGPKRAAIADEGIAELSKYVDSLIIVPNSRLLAVLGKSASLLDAFKKANDVLKDAVQGVSELITKQGMMNVDFADVRTVMSEMGMAMMGSGVAQGDSRAKEAVEAAMSCPFLEDVNLSGARGMLVNITAGLDMSMGEFEEIGNTARGLASDGATVIVGTVFEADMGDELRVTIVATGLDKANPAAAEKVEASKRESVEKSAPVVAPESEISEKVEREPVRLNTKDAVDNGKLEFGVFNPNRAPRINQDRLDHD
ncbi:MAG TPA: cell division protein FtsZ, partial [Gammaproteobacteria bacterium]|nr:cell division protein FtsZ [Gammaproteobacteria bacterium]